MDNIIDVYAVISDAAGYWKELIENDPNCMDEEIFSSLHIDQGFLPAESILVGNRDGIEYKLDADVKKMFFFVQSDVQPSVPMIFILQFCKNGGSNLILEVGSPFRVKFEGV